jgi:hypothetical protein
MKSGRKAGERDVLERPGIRQIRISAILNDESHISVEKFEKLYL